MSVDISTVNKVSLLKTLWEHSKPAAFFTMSGVPPPSWSPTGASEAVKGYIDYFQGRMIKTDLSKNTADPYSYDRDYGQGTFQNLVNLTKNGSYF